MQDLEITVPYKNGVQGQHKLVVLDENDGESVTIHAENNSSFTTIVIDKRHAELLAHWLYTFLDENY